MDVRAIVDRALHYLINRWSFQGEMAESRTASILALMLRRLALDHEELLGDKRAAVTLGEHVLQLGGPSKTCLEDHHR